jgi:hypothetical protein
MTASRELTLARAKIGEILEPPRQGLREIFGVAQKEAARGLTVRCDWALHNIADAWIAAVRWLGLIVTPSYVGEPGAAA